MPAKNIIKTYVENGYYHVYNRGVEKRLIFLDEQDCKVFLRYIKLYLSPVEEVAKLQGIDEAGINKFIRLNLFQEIDLLSFALMPNHFHLQIKQYSKDGITKFVRRLITSYVMYFNRKYKRVGSLFQNTYKACLVEKDEYLLHLSRYIHRNSFGLETNIDFLPYSSYPYYLGFNNASWIKPQEILGYFKDEKDEYGYNSYKDFVEFDNSSTENILNELILEDAEAMESY